MLICTYVETSLDKKAVELFFEQLLTSIYF